VAPAQERDEGQLDLVVLPEDDPLDVLDDTGDLPGERSAVQTNIPLKPRFPN